MVPMPQSPLAAWTPSPQLPSNDGPQGAHNLNTGWSPSTGSAKVSSSTASKQGSLVGPFKERLLQSAELNSAATSRPGRKPLQPPVSHSGNDRQRTAVPKKAVNLFQSTKSGVYAPTGRSQGLTSDCSRHDHRAVARQAARQAALSDTNDALQPLQPQQQSANRATAHWPSSLQELHQHSRKPSKSNRGGASSLNTTVETAPALANLQLSDSLQVKGVKQNKEQGQQQLFSTSDLQGGFVCLHETDNAAQHRASSPEGNAVVVATTGPLSLQERGPRKQCQPHLYTQLLQYSYAVASNIQQTPAAAVAAQALIKRLRLQQRSRQGPQPFQRGLAPRPTSPPPIELSGALLLASCPDACCPAELTTADLTSSDISVIPLPMTVSYTDQQKTVTVQDAAEVATERTTASVAAAASASELLQFTRLGVLDLSDNRLRCIAGLAWLPALWQLSVSANRLNTLQSLAQVLGFAMTKASEQQPTDSEELSELCSKGSAACSCADSLIDNDEGSSEEPQVDDDGCTKCCADLGNADRASSHGQSQTDVCREVDKQLTAEHRSAGLLVSEPSPAEITTVPSATKSANSLDREEVLTDSPSTQSISAVQPTIAVCSGGFGELQVLDVSYNMLPAADLLGQQSALAKLPSLRMLIAGGNDLRSLPTELGPFSSLTHLNLADNKLTDNALLPLSKLPVLGHLVLANNPIKAAPHALVDADSTTLLEEHVTDSSTAATAAACNSFRHLCWLDLSHSHVDDCEHLLPLLSLPTLGVVQLTGTPLGKRCESSREAVQVLEDAGLQIVTHQHVVPRVWQHNAKQKSQQGRGLHQGRKPDSDSTSSCLPFIAVDENIPASGVLAAASTHAIMELQHEQLMAAFERVGERINNWQLTPIIEEDSTAWDPEYEVDQDHCIGTTSVQKKNLEDDEPLVDNTFLTGVGITGSLPSDHNDQAQISGVGAFGSWQDPTERLALALGMQVSQLAHYTHIQPGNPTGAIHRLRHALVHPLVDPEAGQRPEQHHTIMTAAVVAKQRPRKLLPLPQPISTTLDTQVVAVHGIDSLLHDMRGRLQALEGSLLQQLQVQANKLSDASHQMTQSSLAEGATHGQAHVQQQ